MIVPLALLVAEAGVVQVLFGFPLYDLMYHLPGGHLASAFTANMGGLGLPRAVGTYAAPNEFGLGLDIYLLAVMLPLAFTRPTGAARALLVAAGVLTCIALVLTYSRSAWVGLAVASVVVGIVMAHPAGRWLRAQGERRPGIRAVQVVALMAAVGFVFAVSGGASFLLATVSGHEASAAGRPLSIARGLAELVSHPLGLGLTAAGPKAFSINDSAVQTENWYLVYGIQAGWLAVGALSVFGVACLVALMRSAWMASEAALHSDRMAFQVGSSAALAAALTGAFFIPALLDLPASLTLWTLVAAALGLGLESASSQAQVAATSRPRSERPGDSR